MHIVKTYMETFRVGFLLDADNASTASVDFSDTSRNCLLGFVLKEYLLLLVLVTDHPIV